MTRRQQLLILFVAAAFLLATAVGGAHRRNVPHVTPQPARPAIAPSPYPHAWEVKY